MTYDIRRYQHRRMKGFAQRQMAAYRGKRKETKEKRNQEIKSIMWKLEPVTILKLPILCSIRIQTAIDN